jgi:hypothetical protein
MCNTASAESFQIPDVSVDQGIKVFTAGNNHATSDVLLTIPGWVPLIGDMDIINLPFIGSYGKEGTENQGLGKSNNTYFSVTEKASFNTEVTDAIGKVNFKFILPGDKDSNSYFIPINFTTNATSIDCYIKIERVNTDEYTNGFKLSILNESQSELCNRSFSGVFSDDTCYIDFENSKVRIVSPGDKITGLNPLVDSDILNLDSGTRDYIYNTCKILTFDIATYPYPAQCAFTVMDRFELEKEYDSIIMKIYSLITKIVADKNQNLYYLFRAADSLWSITIALIIMCFSMPFMWLCFAGICGLCSCVFRGNIKSGIPAGIRTFVNVCLIPVKLIQVIIDLLAKIIQGIKPV